MDSRVSLSTSTVAVLPTAAAAARVLLGLGDRPPAYASTGIPPVSNGTGAMARYLARREPLGSGQRVNWSRNQTSAVRALPYSGEMPMSLEGDDDDDDDDDDDEDDSTKVPRQS